MVLSSWPWRRPEFYFSGVAFRFSAGVAFRFSARLVPGFATPFRGDVEIRLRSFIDLRRSVVLTEFSDRLRHKRRSGTFHFHRHEFLGGLFGQPTCFVKFHLAPFVAGSLDLLPGLGKILSRFLVERLKSPRVFLVRDLLVPGLTHHETAFAKIHA